MTTAELRTMCEQADCVNLRLPPSNGNGYTRRLCDRRGPRGIIICGTAEWQVVRFESAAVLRFLDREEAERD